MPDPGDDQHTDVGYQVDEQATAGGAREQPGSQASGDASAPAATRKRKRGPNKPKPNLFTVQTDANMAQPQIVALLTASAEQHLGKEAAANMELQVDFGGGAGWESAALRGAVVRFATKGHK